MNILTIAQGNLCSNDMVIKVIEIFNKKKVNLTLKGYKRIRKLYPSSKRFNQEGEKYLKKESFLYDIIKLMINYKFI